jgi:ubiquinone/menaquinone biosynthesis C-methylase UbiE
MSGLRRRVYRALQRGIAPTLKFSQTLYEETLSAAVTPETRWLDLGCGHQILPAWRHAAEEQLAGRVPFLAGLDGHLDSLRNHKTVRLRVLGQIEALPFDDASFNLVTANMVLEHVAQPETCLREISRILAPGGLFLCHTPNVWGYPTMLGRLLPDAVKRRMIKALDGREEHDVFTTHYLANSERRLARLAHGAGLEVQKIRLIATAAVFANIAPLALVELLWIRVLLTKPFAAIRPDIIATLRKPAARV